MAHDPLDYDDPYWDDEEEDEDDIDYTDLDELGDFLYHQWKDDQE